MTVLQKTVRDELLKLIAEEILMVDTRAKLVAEQHWRMAEHEVARQLGYGDALVRAEHLRNQIEGLQRELADLESTMRERAERPSPGEYFAKGFEIQVDRYGNTYGVPVVFNREIRSRWDLAIFNHLNETINFFQVYRTLKDLNHSVRRELLLAGTYEDARAIYQKFHEKVLTALGTDLPGLLAEINNIPALKAPGTE